MNRSAHEKIEILHRAKESAAVFETERTKAAARTLSESFTAAAISAACGNPETTYEDGFFFALASIRGAPSKVSGGIRRKICRSAIRRSVTAAPFDATAQERLSQALFALAQGADFTSFEDLHRLRKSVWPGESWTEGLPAGISDILIAFSSFSSGMIEACLHGCRTAAGHRFASNSCFLDEADLETHDVLCMEELLAQADDLLRMQEGGKDAEDPGNPDDPADVSFRANPKEAA